MYHNRLLEKLNKVFNVTTKKPWRSTL